MNNMIVIFISQHNHPTRTWPLAIPQPPKNKPIKPFELFYRRELKKARSENPNISAGREMWRKIKQRWEEAPEGVRESYENAYLRKKVGYSKTNRTSQLE